MNGSMTMHFGRAPRPGVPYLNMLKSFTTEDAYMHPMDISRRMNIIQESNQRNREYEILSYSTITEEIR